MFLVMKTIVLGTDKELNRAVYSRMYCRLEIKNNTIAKHATKNLFYFLCSHGNRGFE